MSSMSLFRSFTESQKRQKQMSIVIRWIVALFLILFAVFPVLWILSASVNPIDTLATQSLIPSKAGLDNYRELLTIDDWINDVSDGVENSLTWDYFHEKVVEEPIFPFETWLFNSVWISLVTTILSVSVTTLAAYSFSRFRFSGRVTLLKMLLLIQVFPSLLAMVAIFLMISELGDQIEFLALDTHLGLILVYLGGAMGINIWLMKGFFDSIPREIDESAMVDGASHWQIFTQLLLPLMRPILIVIAILSFIGTYGDFILARVLLKDTEKYTLMVGLQIFTSGQFSQNWGQFTAGALIGALPIMIIYLVLQDKIVGGLTQGSVKG